MKLERGAKPNVQPAWHAQMRLCISYLPTDWLCCCHLVNDL